MVGMDLGLDYQAIGGFFLSHSDNHLEAKRALHCFKDKLRQ